MRFLSTFLVFILSIAPIFSQSYTSYFTGNTMDKVVDDLEFSLTVMGGGTEVDYAMKLFLEDAKRGDVLVLRTSGSDGYNDYMFSELGVQLNSVETIVCHNKNASYDPYVHDRILKAEAVWFAGGDQWKYLDYWRGTPIQQYLNFAILDKGMPVGGTSAGLAIMGQYQFTAENGTVTSEQALANPYDERMTIDNRPFLIMPLPIPIIFDSHFDDPDRKGRLITFMARIKKDYGEHAVGIGLDEYTAARLKGVYMNMLNDSYGEDQDFVHVFSYDCNTQPSNFVVEPDMPLTWSEDHIRYRKYRSAPSPVTFINLDSGSFNVIPDIDNEINIMDGSIAESTTSSSTFPMMCSQVNSLEKEEDISIRISPNPSNSLLMISSETANIDQMQIYSENGKLVASYDSDRLLNRYEIDISKLEAGTYFLKMFSGKKEFVRQFIKL